jgi:hypothetical protein
VSRKPMSLKKLAEHLGLSPATVSLVINRSIVADSIPQETKDRILRPPVSSNIAAIFLHELCAHSAASPLGSSSRRSATGIRRQS